MQQIDIKLTDLPIFEIKAQLDDHILYNLEVL